MLETREGWLSRRGRGEEEERRRAASIARPRLQVLELVDGVGRLEVVGAHRELKQLPQLGVALLQKGASGV